MTRRVRKTAVPPPWVKCRSPAACHAPFLRAFTTNAATSRLHSSRMKTDFPFDFSLADNSEPQQGYTAASTMSPERRARRANGEQNNRRKSLKSRAVMPGFKRHVYSGYLAGSCSARGSATLAALLKRVLEWRRAAACDERRAVCCRGIGRCHDSADMLLIMDCRCVSFSGGGGGAGGVTGREDVSGASKN